MVEEVGELEAVNKPSSEEGSQIIEKQKWQLDCHDSCWNYLEWRYMFVWRGSMNKESKTSLI